MEKENVLQLNLQSGYCFQDFIKAFSKNLNLKKKSDQYMISFIGESGVK